MHPEKREQLFRILSGLFAIAAIYHLINLFQRLDNSPAGRHVIFIIVSLFCAWCFLKRPKYFVYFFALLLIQQCASHGSYLISQWSEAHKVHWPSLGVLIFMPLAMLLLILDFRSKYNSNGK